MSRAAKRARADMAALLRLVEDPNMVRNARLDEIERVVADLCEREGIVFRPRAALAPLPARTDFERLFTPAERRKMARGKRPKRGGKASGGV